MKFIEEDREKREKARLKKEAEERAAEEKRRKEEEERRAVEERKKQWENGIAVRMEDFYFIPRTIKSLKLTANSCNEQSETGVKNYYRYNQRCQCYFWNDWKFDTSNFHNLESVVIEKNSLTRINSFSIGNMSNLLSITIGMKCCCNEAFPSQARSMIFSITNCPKLGKLSVGSYSFSDCSTFILRSTWIESL